MLTYLLIGIVTGLLIKANSEIAEQELMLSTYIILSLFWFISLPLLIWNLLIKLLLFIVNFKND